MHRITLFAGAILLIAFGVFMVSNYLTGGEDLAGVDVNNNGVRDDVESYIELTYPDGRVRNALMRYASATQAFLLNAEDRGATIENVKLRDRALDCLDYLRPEDSNVMRKELRAIILNTYERSRAYVKADAQLGGLVFSPTPEDQKQFACDN